MDTYSPKMLDPQAKLYAFMEGLVPNELRRAKEPSVEILYFSGLPR